MARTWNETVVEINPNSYNETSILSGKANVCFLSNYSDKDIYISMSNIPRIDNYEKIIRPNSSDVFGRPTPVSRVYLYNPSDEKVFCRLWSAWEENFDFSLMKSMNVNLEAAAVEALKNDGIIRGVQSGVKLPVAGSDLTAIKNTAANIYTLMQQQATKNQTILEGINTILQSL